MSAEAAKIQVTALDAQGKRIASALIRLEHPGTGAQSECRTTAAGECELDYALPATYRLLAMSEGLEAVTMVTLKPGAPAVALTLRPALLHSSITVMSGSRQQELQDESATKVDVVSRAEMLTMGAERVSDVLQEVPGVLVRRGNTSTVGGEQIQGVDSRQVLLLQDGLPVLGARGIKSGVLNLNRQSSDRISRVEVAKGSGSALYGSDAIGGVIHLITREASAPLQGGLVLSGGTLGMMDARGDIGGKRERFSYFLDLGQSRMDSYSLLANSPTTVGPQVRRNDGLAKARMQLRPGLSLGVTANAYHNNEQGRSASETGLVAGNTNDSAQSYALVADYAVNSATMVQGRAYTARYDENSTTTPLSGGSATPANLNERLHRLDATVSNHLSTAHLLQGGVEWVQNTYRGANRLLGDNLGQQVTATDTWVQDKWTPTARLTVTAGGRLTNHSRFGNAAVPKVGAVYQIAPWLLARASFGLGFRAPDLGQLYYRFANPASFYQVIGNPNLRPEHSQSWQGGLTVRRARYRAGVTYFQNNIRDLIDTRLIGTPRTSEELNSLLAQYNLPAAFQPLLGRQVYAYFNQARIVTQGVELDGQVQLTSQLRASGSYTYLDAKDRVTQLGLTQRHPHTGLVRVDYSIPKYGVVTNIRGAFYSSWLLNAAAGTMGLAYQIWDAYAAKKWPHHLETFVAVDNLAGSRDGKLALASPTFDRPDYGRTVRLGMRFRFGGGE